VLVVDWAMTAGVIAKITVIIASPSHL
jgi:hypothetical protein